MLEINLTKNNHFQFGYDGQPFVSRNNPNQQWWVSYGICERSPQNFYTECLIAAEEIKIEADKKDLWICYSGGVDSEVCLKTFSSIKNNAQVHAAILKFKNGLNDHDVSFAVQFCKKNDVKFKIFEIDLIDFWESGEMRSICENTGCVSPQFASTMKLTQLINQIDGYPIIGSGECYLEYIENDWLMYEREKVAALYRYMILNKIRGQAGFFQWSPELMLSFLDEPELKNLVSNFSPSEKNTTKAKTQIYEKYFHTEKRKKYTGFEKVMDLDRKHRLYLLKKNPERDQTCVIPYKDLVEHLKQKISTI